MSQELVLLRAALRRGPGDGCASSIYDSFSTSHFNGSPVELLRVDTQSRVDRSIIGPSCGYSFRMRSVLINRQGKGEDAGVTSRTTDEFRRFAPALRVTWTFRSFRPINNAVVLDPPSRYSERMSVRVSTWFMPQRTMR
jgi:hypothetical protein